MHEFRKNLASIKGLCELALEDDMDDGATRNSKRIQRRVDWLTKCRRATFKQHATKIVEAQNTIGVAKDKDGEYMFRKGFDAKMLKKALDELDMVEKTIDIVMVDAKLLKEGYEKPKPSVKRGCEFMFTNIWWDDEDGDDDLDVPAGLKKYMDPEDEPEADDAEEKKPYPKGERKESSLRPDVIRDPYMTQN